MKEEKPNTKLLNNLLGQTVKDTLFFSNLNPAPYMNQKMTTHLKKEEEPKKIEIPKQNITHQQIKPTQFRNSDGYKKQSNYGNKFAIDNNNKIRNNRGKDAELKKLNTIEINGKIIHNIDINVDSLETIVETNKKDNKYINNNLPDTKIKDKNRNNILIKNNVEKNNKENQINKNETNNKNDVGNLNNIHNKDNSARNNNNMQQNHNKVYYAKNNNTIQQNHNKAKYIQNNNIQQNHHQNNNIQQNHNKINSTKNNNIVQQKHNNINFVNNNIHNTVIPFNNIQQNLNKINSANINTQNTVAPINNIKQNLNKINSDKIHQNHNKLNSVNNTIQPNIKEKKTIIVNNLEENKKDNYSKIVPDKTIQSIYKTKECVNQSNYNNNGFSKIIPQETVKSIYAMQNSNINNIITNETIISVEKPIKESANNTNVIKPVTESIYKTKIISPEEAKRLLNSNNINPIEEAQSRVKPINESNNQIIPQEIVQSVYTSKAMNNNTQYANLIPQGTINSVYNPIKESNSKNIIKGNESSLSKMAQSEATSIYKNNDNKKVSIKEENKNIRSMMPNETITSVHMGPNIKLNETADPLMKLIPNETVKSIYKTE